MNHNAALRAPLAHRPVIDYAPGVRNILTRRDAQYRAERRAWWLARIGETFVAMLLVGFFFIAINVTEVISRYAIAIERAATTQAENAELRARIRDADAWSCREMGVVRDGTRFRWCSKEASK